MITIRKQSKKIFEGKVNHELSETVKKELRKIFYDNVEAYGFVGYATT